MISISKTIFLAIILTSCGQESSKKQVAKEEPIVTTEPTVAIEKAAPVPSPSEKPVAAELKRFSKIDVAKFTISAIMDQPPEIINVRMTGDIYYASYVRKSDGQKFVYKIKFEGNNKVVWGNSDGRWRDSAYDERISYREIGSKLNVVQTFEDGSTIDKEFEKGH